MNYPTESTNNIPLTYTTDNTNGDPPDWIKYFENEVEKNKDNAYQSIGTYTNVRYDISLDNPLCKICHDIVSSKTRNICDGCLEKMKKIKKSLKEILSK